MIGGIDVVSLCYRILCTTTKNLPREYFMLIILACNITDHRLHFDRSLVKYMN